MGEHVYLVFGDLHGRVLPAFRLAQAWARDHGVRVVGLLQVGDLGYFPDLSRLDKASKRHADDDPMELGVQDVIAPTRLADEIFAAADVPEALWFTAGNHEDFDSLQQQRHGDVGPDGFVVDYYRRVRCLPDGEVARLPEGLRVGALWGVDGAGPNARQHVASRGYIQPRSALQLSYEAFDILLTHDSPRDARRAGYGSDEVTALIELAKPALAFFGHYKGAGCRALGDFGPTQVYHMAGLTFRGRNGCAEAGSVGVLRWDGTACTFAYVADDWLHTITRENWRRR